jgi:ketosteroid isomerase-like protein
MSKENVEIMRRMYEAWLAGGSAVFGDARMNDLLDPEFELHPDPGAYWVGVDETYRGPEGLAKYMAAIYDAFDDYTPEVEQFLDAEDKVVTLAVEHGRGRDSGAEVEHRRTAHVWTLRDGKPVRLDLYLDRQRALDDLGLSE